MTKIVYNGCYGCFGLSDEGVMRYAEIKGIKLYPEKSKYSILGNVYYTKPVEERTPEDSGYFYPGDIDRADPALVQVVEELGDEASGRCSSLHIEDIPKGERYRIDEYDGMESVETINSYEWKIA